MRKKLFDTDLPAALISEADMESMRTSSPLGPERGLPPAVSLFRELPQSARSRAVANNCRVQVGLKVSSNVVERGNTGGSPAEAVADNFTSHDWKVR